MTDTVQLPQVQIGWLTPPLYTQEDADLYVAMMVLGGRGTFVGAIVGAVLLTVLPEFLGRFAEYKLLLYGMLMVVLITLMPDGIVGRLRRVGKA